MDTPNRIRRCLCLGLAILLLPCIGITEETEATLSISSDSLLAFSNVLFHYVEIQAEVQGADQLVLRVYKPDGSKVRYKTLKIAQVGGEPIFSSAFPVNGTENKLSGTQVLFPRNSVAGTWTIEVRAMLKDEIVAVATLPVQIRDPYPVEPENYDEMHALLLPGEGPLQAEKGRIRFVSQMPNDHHFVKNYWRSKYFDLIETAKTKCTRAVYSMALSWLGIDCTPVKMSELVTSQEIYFTYEHVTEALGNVERVDGELEELWDQFLYEGASPVEIHFVFDGGMHALLLIGRDTKNPDMYYAVNPGDGVNASAYGGYKHEHVIPIVIEDGRLGCEIQSPLVKRFNRAKMDVICQWRLKEETGKEE